MQISKHHKLGQIPDFIGKVEDNLRISVEICSLSKIKQTYLKLSVRNCVSLIPEARRRSVIPSTKRAEPLK